MNLTISKTGFRRYSCEHSICGQLSIRPIFLFAWSVYAEEEKVLHSSLMGKVYQKRCSVGRMGGIIHSTYIDSLDARSKYYLVWDVLGQNRKFSWYVEHNERNVGYIRLDMKYETLHADFDKTVSFAPSIFLGISAIMEAKNRENNAAC